MSFKNISPTFLFKLIWWSSLRSWDLISCNKTTYSSGMSHLPLKEMSAQTSYLHLWIETFCLPFKKYGFRLTWNCQESDEILPPVFRVKTSRNANSPCCPVARSRCHVPSVAVPTSAMEGQVKAGVNLPSLYPSRWRKETCKLWWSMKESFSPSCSKCGA